VTCVVRALQHLLADRLHEIDLLASSRDVIVLAMGCLKHIAFYGTSLAACYAPPATSERFEDSIVVTSSDGEADFASFQTFFVREDIRVLDESSGVDGAVAAETMPAPTASSLIEATAEQLVARGYRRAAVKTEADLAVELVYLRTAYTDYYCYNWSDWYYWGYPGYSYYYPYSCDTAAWRSGMMVTNVIDLRAAGPARDVTAADTMGNSVLRGVWFSGIYGVEIDSSTSVESMLGGIDQAFVQSPYFSAAP
jgi:hypothetical protein